MAVTVLHFTLSLEATIGACCVVYTFYKLVCIYICTQSVSPILVSLNVCHASTPFNFFFYEIRNYALSSQAPFLLTNKPHVHCFSSPVSVKTATVLWPTDNFPFLKRFVQWKFSRSDEGENFAVMLRTTKEWLATKKQPKNGWLLRNKHFLKLLDGKIGESNVSIVELSDKKLLHVQQRCTLCTYDYVIRQCYCQNYLRITS